MMGGEYLIRSVEINDGGVIRDIYNFYIINTNISFEEKSVSISEMKERISKYSKEYPWLVYEEDEQVLGYAYASKWKTRNAYKHTVEVSVYVKSNTRRKGIGTMLYKQLLDRLSNYDVHAVIGVIALPNEGSIKLHENLGFTKVAHFKEVGYKFNKWIDVGYWQYMT